MINNTNPNTVCVWPTLIQLSAVSLIIMFQMAVDGERTADHKNLLYVISLRLCIKGEITLDKRLAGR